MQFDSHTNHQQPNLHQQLSLLRGDSTFSDAFTSNMVPFDFPEIELAGSDSIAISLGFGFGADSTACHFNYVEEKMVKESENLNQDEKEIVGEESESSGCDIDSNKANLDNSFGSLLGDDEKVLERENGLKVQKEELSVTKRIKKKKKEEKKQKNKRTKKNKDKEEKVRREKKVIMQKSAQSIMQSLAIDMDGIFKLYPTLKEKASQKKKMHKISTFPSVFAGTDYFCYPPDPKKKASKKGRSQKTKSTMDCDIENLNQTFGDVKSTLVRSKVNNLKGSMFCFEMTNNLREMVEISKCMKWQRRWRYRKELAEKDSSSSGDDYGESYSGDEESVF